MGNKQTKNKKSGKPSKDGGGSLSQSSSDNSAFKRQSGGRASPPRGISGVLASADYTTAFRTHLKDLDDEKEDDDATNVTRLDFVVALRKLYDALPPPQTNDTKSDSTRSTSDITETAVVNLCLEVHRDFLDGKKRVALENPKLREELTKQLATVKANKKFTSTDQKMEVREVTCKALKDAETLLDGHHKTFLRKREKAKNTACLLSIL